MRFIFFTATFIFLGFFSFVLAQEFQGSSFKVMDPVIYSGNFASSTNFRLFGSIGEIGIGTSTATSFGVKAGFLYFPAVTSPVVTATAGSGQVSLSWTASTGFLGWVVSSYSVGQSSVSGGPYTYSNVGNNLSSTATGLSNGTTYYFIVQALDAFGRSIATSTQVSATPVAGVGGGGGGGSGGGIPAQVTFSGLSYPDSTVVVLKDGMQRERVNADSEGNFSATISNLSFDPYIFALYAIDPNGNNSTLRLVPVTISGVYTTISGIILPPTITSDKEVVTKGEPILFSGFSQKDSNVLALFDYEEKNLGSVLADSRGFYSFNMETGNLSDGEYFARSQSVIGQLASPISSRAVFRVGKETVPRKPTCHKADFNCDGRINLVDFSILLYWADIFERGREVLPKYDLSGDKKIDLRDYSILVYYWTG